VVLMPLVHLLKMVQSTVTRIYTESGHCVLSACMTVTSVMLSSTENR
jgi:hypothetical protein